MHIFWPPYINRFQLQRNTVQQIYVTEVSVYEIANLQRRILEYLFSLSFNPHDVCNYTLLNAHSSDRRWQSTHIVPSEKQAVLTVSKRVGDAWLVPLYSVTLRALIW
jgi:hypothetical protein